MNKIKMLTIIGINLVLMLGCVSTSHHKQSEAVKTCRAFGGTVTYNTFSVDCQLPSGNSFRTY